MPNVYETLWAKYGDALIAAGKAECEARDAVRAIFTPECAGTTWG